MAGVPPAREIFQAGRPARLEQQRFALESCFEKIPVPERSLLTRAYQRDVQIQEAAAASGRTVGGFYQWLHRMRKLLLECIQRELAKESP